MFRSRLASCFVCVLIASCAVKPNPGESIPNVQADAQQLREHFAAQRNDGRCGFGLEGDMKWANAAEEGLCELVLGEQRTFAACAFLLSNQPDEQTRAEVFLLLSRRKGDRSQFVPFASTSLRHADAWVRACAVTLLGKIGTPNELLALRAMLGDADPGVVITTAEILASSGGPDDLIAVDRWLVGPGLGLGDEGYTREVVGQHRVALKARLTVERKWPIDQKK